MSGKGDDYIIDTATPAEEPAVRELLREMIGENAITQWSEQFWSWKHRRSPFGPSYVAVARSRREGDRVVSVQHAIPWALETSDGEPITATRPCDGATYPEHQRKGLYTRIDRQTQQDLPKRGVRFVFDTPNPLTLGRNLKTGSRIVARYPHFWAPVLSLATLGALLPGRSRRGPAPPPDVPESLFPTWSGLLERYGDQVGKVVAAHEQGRIRVGLRTPRTLAYLHWRYGEIPTVKYRAFVAEEGGKLDGFVVWRAGTGKRGLPTAIVTELFLRKPSVSAAAELLRTFRRHCTAGYVLTFFPEGTLERAALGRAGFRQVPRQARVFTAKPLLATSIDPTLASSWDLTLGELEVF